MYYSIESGIALFVSFLINLFVLAVFAEAFSGPDYSDASQRVAGTWLYDRYGLAMKIIWAVGLLAAGQSSTMTGTYAGQFVMQGFINIQWPKWKRVLLTRSIAMIPTIVVALLATDYLDRMNTWLNVLQTVQLPFALLPILHCTNSKRIMGDFRNGGVRKTVVWCLAVLIMVINFYLVVLFVGPGQAWYIYFVTAIVLFAYSCCVGYVAIGPSQILQLKKAVATRLGRDTAALEHEIEHHKHQKYVPEDYKNAENDAQK